MEHKRAVAGLWAVPGLGPITISKIEAKFSLAEITDCLIAEWVELAEGLLPTYARECIPRGRSLGELGDELLDAARRHQMKIAWRGETEYPARLAEIRDPPPLLFYWGPGTDAPPRRRVAMVGTRHPDSLCIAELTQLIEAVAVKGVGVVSGAAFGIDTLAHRRSADVGGETWAFLGSSLDQLDLHPRRLWDELGPKHATFWSELPPGVRAERKRFPRRNRLISGSSDAVAVLRARSGSGTQHTVEYALRQGRPVLACPGAIADERVEYCLKLLRDQKAAICIGPEDILAAVGVTGWDSHVPAPVDTRRVDPKTLSANAQAALAALEYDGICFDDLLAALPLRSGQLLAAMGELVVSGLVHEHKGRRYQKA